MRGRTAAKVLAVAMLLVSVLASATAMADATDPIEGKWLGVAGFPQDRVTWGFEFKRDEKGAIAAFFYSPVINFYGLPVPGELVRRGSQYTNKDWNLTLSFDGGKLNGTMFFNNVPLTLERTEVLPSEVPVPELARGPGPKWQTKLGAAIYARAATFGGTAYVGTTGGMFYAIDLKGGGFVWAFSAGRPILGEALATKDDVYFVCDNGFLFKLARETGKEVWRYDLGDARTPRLLPHQVVTKSGDFDFDFRAPRPLLVEHTLYVGSGDGSFHAVDAASGRRVWQFLGKGKIRTDAVLDGPHLIVGTSDNFILAVDRKSGAEVWRTNTKAEVTSSPALIDGTIVAGNRGGLLLALRPSNGDVVWKTQLWGSSVESTAVPAGGRLFYIGSSDLRRVALMDSRDGRVIWRTDVFGWAWARPEVYGKRIYASAAGGDPYEIRHLGSLVAMDRESGKIMWRWPMPPWPGSWLNGFAAAPAVEGSMLVVGGLDGSLYGFPVD